MELRHLRYFLAVAEELHFTRAAARLHIGQPPLSQQIQALEAELGVALFLRTRRSVRLTEAGEHLLGRAREILAASQGVATELQRIARGEQGELRIGFTSTGLLVEEMRRGVASFRKTSPGVVLRLREMYTFRQFEALAAGELDVGLVRFNGPLAPPGIGLRPLRSDPLCLVVPEGHRLAGRAAVSIAECRDEAFIAYPAAAGASLVGQLDALCRRAGFRPRIAQEAREALTQIGLVATGMGVAVLLGPMAALGVGGVRFVPLADDGASLQLAVATRSGETSPRVQAFVATLVGA